jgi:hypothetical protein
LADSEINPSSQALSTVLSVKNMDAPSLEAIPDWTVLLPDDTFYLWESNDFDPNFLPASGEELDPWFPSSDTPDSHEFYVSAISPIAQNDEMVSAEGPHGLEGSDGSDSDIVVLTPMSSSEPVEELGKVASSMSASTMEDLLCTPDQSEGEKHPLHTSKRKWEESLIIFSSDPNGATKVRKRNAFNDARRREVALNRRVGACVQCKLRRGCVSYSLTEIH